MPAPSQAAPDSRLAAGTCLGKYQVLRLIGEGGMGTVYEGVHLAIGKEVAIKVMSPDLAANPDARARFLREAQLTSRVRHPHAVDVVDVGSEAGQTFLVIELLDGEDLASFIAWRGRLPLEQAADIMLPVCAAVAAAHDEGIIHRDLKPSNIFLSQRGMERSCLRSSTSASRRGRWTNCPPLVIDRATNRDPAARYPSVHAMGGALLEFASPKTALAWARTFSDGETAEAIPALSIPRRSFARRIAAALAVLVAAGAIAWWTLRAPAASRQRDPAAAGTLPR